MKQEKVYIKRTDTDSTINGDKTKSPEEKELFCVTCERGIEGEYISLGSQWESVFNMCQRGTAASSQSPDLHIERPLTTDLSTAYADRHSLEDSHHI